MRGYGRFGLTAGEVWRGGWGDKGVAKVDKYLQWRMEKKGTKLNQPTRAGTTTTRIRRTEGRFWRAVSSNMMGDLDH